MNDTELTEAERGDILTAAWDEANPDWDAMLREVERIVAARVAAAHADALAPVLALADQWEQTEGRPRQAFLVAADELRAGVAFPEPTEGDTP